MHDPIPETPPSAEIDLLLTCATWPQDAAVRERVLTQLAQPLDWSHFLLLVQHHRLVPLVFANLNACVLLMQGSQTDGLRKVLDQLRQLAAANTYAALRSLSELRRLIQELQARHIRVRVLKGLPLAQTAFGDINLRAVGDLDLLIDEGSILEADRILQQAGYRGLFALERLTPKRLAFYRTHWKDVAYHNPATGFEVDLHWRCFRNREMPGNTLCATPAEEIVSFGTFQVPALPATETLLYLCVHGTLDGWLYLRSLADVSALARAMSAAQLDAVSAAAADYGILPELSAALLLVQRYFWMQHWSARLLNKSHPTVHHILRFADRFLVGGNFLANRDHVSTNEMMAFELGLRPHVRYRLELLVRVLFRARMWETMPLPDFLFGLYPLLSPLEWIFFRVRRLRAK